jgi:hypothetical protein
VSVEPRGTGERPIDDYIGQYDYSGPGPPKKRSVLTKADKRRFKVLIGVTVVITLIILGTALAYSMYNTIETDVRVEYHYSQGLLYGDREVWIFIDYQGFLGGRVGDASRKVGSSSGTFTATFTVNHTGSYEVHAGVNELYGSTFQIEEVELTRGDDGNVVVVIIS